MMSAGKPVQDTVVISFADPDTVPEFTINCMAIGTALGALLTRSAGVSA